MSRLRSLTRQSGFKRATPAAGRLFLERTLLAATHRGEPRATGRILCYHSIGTPAWGVNDVSPALFRRQLEWALRAGYRFVPAREIAADGRGPCDLAVTFDDGLASVAINAAPILTELGIPWSVFVVSDWAAGRHGFGDGVILSWSEIARLAETGVEVGSHSVSHPNFGRIEMARAREELYRSRAAIAEHIGQPPTAFAIPMGGSRDWTAQAHQLAREAGYELVYSQAERTRVAGTLPRTFITCFDGMRLFRAALRGAFDNWEERV